MKEKQTQTEQQMTMFAIKMLFSMLSSPRRPLDMRLIYDRTKIFFQAVKTIK